MLPTSSFEANSRISNPFKFFREAGNSPDNLFLHIFNERSQDKDPRVKWDGYGWIIDGINIKCCGKCTYEITFYSPAGYLYAEDNGDLKKVRKSEDMFIIVLPIKFEGDSIGPKPIIRMILGCDRTLRI